MRKVTMKEAKEIYDKKCMEVAEHFSCNCIIPPPTWICSKCKNKVDEKDNYCNHCGEDVREIEVKE